MFGTSKTDDEILERIKEIGSRDLFGAGITELLVFLPFDKARTFLRAEVTAEQWAERTVEPPLEQLRGYLEFAWEKANNCRGISAARSLDHIREWLWLAGYGDMVAEHFMAYECYGKLQLVVASMICEFNWQDADDGEWRNGEELPALPDAARNDRIVKAATIFGAFYKAQPVDNVSG